MTKQMTEQESILAHLTIIEIATSDAVSMAAQLLAEMGATVIKIESETGSSQRQRTSFAVLNRSKQSVVLDIERQADDLNALLAVSDVLLHDLSSGLAATLGLDCATLNKSQPNLLCAVTTAYPAGHSNEGMPMVDSLVMATSGAMHLQPAVRREGPTYIRFPLPTQTAAYLAAIGVIAKLLANGDDKQGGQVTTSMLQGTMTTLLMLEHRAKKSTESMDGLPRELETQILPCKDGVYLHIQSSPEHVPSFQTALQGCGKEAVAKAAKDTPWYFAFLPHYFLYPQILLQRTSKQWLDDFWANDVAVEPVANVGELFFSEQVKATGYVAEVQDRQHGPSLQPTSPLTISPAPTIKNPAPSLPTAQESMDALNVILKSTAIKAAGITQTNSNKQPLTGMRVLDFGNFLAGPLAPLMMADMGATVIKVEAVTGDQLRFAEWAFAGAQRGKRSLALDLKNPNSQAVIQRLVKWADVVHHNLRMPAANKLGLDYATLKSINPKLIYCHVSAYGSTGPRRDWPGYDQMMQSSSGWEIESAGQDNAPIWLNFGMTDHLCALSSLLATLLATYHQQRSGQAQQVSASLLGATVMSLSEFIVHPDASVEPYEKLDGMQLGLADHHRLYQCADGWVMLYAETAEPLQKVMQTLAINSCKELEQFCLKSNCQSLMQLSTDALHIVKVRDAHDSLLDDSCLQGLGLIAKYPHPIYQELEQMGALWIFDGQPPKFERSPPTLGQHSSEILQEMGYNDAEITKMIATGLIVETEKVNLL